MNRKVLGGVVALVVVLVGVWLLWLRGGSETKHDDAPAIGRTGAVAIDNPTKPTDHPSPRGAAPRWLLDIDPEGSLRLEGQVVGPDGKPVGGAEVWLASVPPRSAKTEDDGGFAFDKLVGRTYRITAMSGNLVGGPVDFKLTQNSDPVVVRLSEGARVVVTVIDEARQPLAGADVKLGEATQRVAKTDAKGEATLEPVHPGWVAMQATAAGFAPATGYATVGAGATGRVTLTLRKGFSVAGHVTDEAGKPLAKVRVYATGGAWDGDDESADGASRDAVITDATGGFAVPALASGTHKLVAIDGDHAPASSAVTINDTAVTGVGIVMATGGVVAGVVVDGDGKPASFATVRVAGSGSQWAVAARQATSDAAGAFELRGLARAKLTARAESERAASALVDVDLTTQPVRKDVKLVLDVTGSIAGIVVDDKGAPVPEIQVNAFPDILSGASTEGLALAGMSNATTDGAGAFTIHGLPDGGYRLWAARANAGQDWGQRGTSAKTGDRNVRITLAAAGGVTGTVVLEGSPNPPKLVRVTLGYQPPTQASDGAFAIKDVEPGSYSISFRGPEFAELVVHDVTIEPGKTTQMGTVKVMRGRRLVGKVIDSSGRPVASATIKLAEVLFSGQGTESQSTNWEEAYGVRSAVSDADGDFTIIGVPTKATNAMADHAKGRSIAVAVPQGTDDPPPMTLTLRGFGSITGKVVYKGQAMAGVTISESSKGGGAQAVFAETDEAGNFTLAKVTEGAHVLQAIQAKAMSMKSTTVTVNVTAGADAKVTIEIPAGQITLTVHVKPLPNNKVDAAQVFVFVGVVAPQNAKQLTEMFFQGGAQGMKIWFGEAKPAPEFDELMPGDYSICTIPITGSLMDPRLRENMALLKVYCRQVKLTASPIRQSIEHAVPAMDPLPTTPPG